MCHDTMIYSILCILHSIFYNNNRQFSCVDAHKSEPLLKMTKHTLQNIVKIIKFIFIQYKVQSDTFYQIFCCLRIIPKGVK